MKHDYRYAGAALDGVNGDTVRGDYIDVSWFHIATAEKYSNIIARESSTRKGWEQEVVWSGRNNNTWKAKNVRTSGKRARVLCMKLDRAIRISVAPSTSISVPAHELIGEVDFVIMPGLKLIFFLIRRQLGSE